MPETSHHDPGTPSWVDLGSPDLDASKTFYGELFGWEAVTSPEPEAGRYTMFTLKGRNVAGVGPLMGEGQPPAWSTYITVEDADATVSTAKDAGANVFLESMDVLDAGRMAVFSDPAGAVICVWQPRAHQGAELVGEAGAMCWHELATRDVEGAKAFSARCSAGTGRPPPTTARRTPSSRSATARSPA